jgi:hypothetical protein
MSKAEEIYGSEFGGKTTNHLLRDRIFDCINASLEWAAQQADDEAQMQRTCINPCGPIEASQYIAERIREGKAK